MNKYEKALYGAIERSSIMNNCCAFVKECIKNNKCHYANFDKNECEDYEVFHNLKELVDMEIKQK
jgi:hypothetical protein